MANKFRFLMAIFFLAAGIAAAQDVRYVFDHHADFSKFKTYRWADLSSEGSPQDRLMEQWIKQAIDRELAAKGLRETDSASADLSIQMRSVTDVQEQFFSFDTGSYGASWDRPIGPLRQGGWWSTTATHAVTVRLIELAQGKPVWAGLVSTQASPDAKPQKQAKSIDKSVKRLLKNYPPKQK
jgi:hypothetical protein